MNSDEYVKTAAIYSAGEATVDQKAERPERAAVIFVIS